MNNFKVEVVTSDNRTTQSCGEYRKDDPVRRAGSYTFNCNSKQGRYVYVTRLQGSRDQQRITLCEVVIDGFIMTTSSSITTTTSSTTITTTTTPSITTITTIGIETITINQSTGTLQNTTPVSLSSKDNGNLLYCLDTYLLLKRYIDDN